MPAYAACYLRRPGTDWPIDIGDDPSFEHAHLTGGCLTWGVCRTDLRNRLSPGDLVVFFAADRLGDRVPARYAWVGYATVERKLSQDAIFQRASEHTYRDYPNLLIRPDANQPGWFDH